MRNKKHIFSYVFVLFFIETILQIFYYGFAIKYFDKYSTFEKLDEILLDSLYVVGLIKLIFFFPLYLIYYFILFSKRQLPAYKQSIYHSLYFLFIFLILSLILPSNIADRIWDTILLTAIAFATSFFLASVSLSKNVNEIV